MSKFWGAVHRQGGLVANLQSYVHTLVSVAPLLAKMCTGFGAPEYAALAFFGLSIIAAVSGDSVIKDIIAELIGVSISFVGVDPICGDLRFTFGSINLMGGVSVVSALIGLYSIPQILKNCLDKDNEKVSSKELTISDIVPPFRNKGRIKSTSYGQALLARSSGLYRRRAVISRLFWLTTRLSAFQKN